MAGASVGPSTVAGLILAMSLSACTASEQDAAVSAADDFVAAVAGGDPDKACAMLAPATIEELEHSSGTTCAAIVLEEAPIAGDRVRTSTFGTMSQVRYADDVLFLSRFDTGWRVVAAGCVGQRGGLYSCEIEGR